MRGVKIFLYLKIYEEVIIHMPLGKHKRTEEVPFRKERADSLVKNLKEDYPVLDQFNDRTKLGTLRDKYDVNSLDQLLKKLKR